LDEAGGNIKFFEEAEKLNISFGCNPSPTKWQSASAALWR